MKTYTTLMLKTGREEIIVLLRSRPQEQQTGDNIHPIAENIDERRLLPDVSNNFFLYGGQRL